MSESSRRHANRGDVRWGEGDAPTIDEQFLALMEGLRTTLPGIEVLLAFLLVVPLQSEFADLDGVQRGAYLGALLCSALSSVLLIAPSAHQRVRAIKREAVRRKHRQHLQYTVGIALAGTGFGAAAVTIATFLATSLVISRGAAFAFAGVVGLVATWSWFWVPLVTFRRRPGHDHEQGAREHPHPDDDGAQEPTARR